MEFICRGGWEAMHVLPLAATRGCEWASKKCKKGKKKKAMRMGCIWVFWILETVTMCVFLTYCTGDCVWLCHFVNRQSWMNLQRNKGEKKKKKRDHFFLMCCKYSGMSYFFQPFFQEINHSTLVRATSAVLSLPNIIQVKVEWTITSYLIILSISIIRKNKVN